MKRQKIRFYKGYKLEITRYGVDVLEPWHPNCYYVLYKVSLKEAIRHIRKHPAPSLESMGWDALVCLDERGGLI